MTIWMWLYSGRSSKRLHVCQVEALRVGLVAAPRWASVLHVLSTQQRTLGSERRTHDTPLVTCPAVTPTRDKALDNAGERIGEGSDMQCAQ